MARTASIAVAGYYPTPRHLIPRIASILKPHTGEQEVVFMDPCAGDGEAILALMKLLCKHQHPTLYACEMEAARCDAFKNEAKAENWSLANNILHGDAFKVTFTLKDKGGVSVLYLNPPYDLDRQHGRLENKFLGRFTPTLMMGGALLFVVPYYALKASAKYLATEYESLHCYKFPSEDFQVFKQVVLFAKKADTRLLPDPAIQAQVEQWAESADGLPELPNLISGAVADVTTSQKHREGLDSWELRPTDVSSLLQKVRPWSQTTRGGSLQEIRGILPDAPVHDLLLRRYPVATPPRPAHIAAGIASGIFNGSRVTPSNQNSSLPDLLVKGTFSKDYRTVEVKESKDGSKTSYVQIQQPKLVVRVLDLRSHKYHTLGSDNDSGMGSDIESLTVAGLLNHYGDSMMGLMRQQCPVLYDPRRDADSISLAETLRKPFTAQGDAAKALVSLLGGPGIPLQKRRSKGAILLGEIGSGKSTCALVVGETIQSKRPLVVCPPHLLTGWTNEIKAVLPDAKVQVLTTIPDVEEVARDTSDQVIVSVLSREMAKLSHGWAGVEGNCPRCGAATTMVAEDLARKRSRCEARPLIGSGLFSDVALDLANRLQPYAPNDEGVSILLHTPWARRRSRHYAAKLEAQEGTEPKFPGLPVDYLDATLEGLVTQDLIESSQNLRRCIVWSLMAIDDQQLIESVAQRYLAKSDWASDQFGRDLLLMLTPNGERQTRIVHEHHKDRTSGYSYYSHWDNVARNAAEALKGERHIKVADLELSWVGGTLTVSNIEGGTLAAATQALRYLIRCSNLKWGQECGEFLFSAVPEPRRVALGAHIQRHYPKLFDFLILDECFVKGTKVSGRPIEEIQVGDFVESYDEATQQVVRSRVTRKWIKVPTSLVRVRFDNGRVFSCTPNHPILTERGWVPAGRLLSKELVHSLVSAEKSRALVGSVPKLSDCNVPHRSKGGSSSHKRLGGLQSKLFGESVNWSPTPPPMGGVVQLVPDSNCTNPRSGDPSTQERIRLLPPRVLQAGEECWNRESKLSSDQEQCGLLLSTHEEKQPYAKPGNSRESAEEVDWPDVLVTRGEWENDETAAAIGDRSGLWLGDGSGDLHCTRQREVPELTELLQGGHRAHRVEARYRSGWEQPQAEEVALSRSKEGQYFGSIRVDSVEVLERGSDGQFGGVCSDGFVYNLEIEGTHTYFAEGVLVHNCHEYSTEGSAQQIASHRLTGLGMPVIAMTGSVMNGYAESLFMLMWAMSKDFRLQFGRTDKQRFIDRYGYRKRLVVENNDGQPKVVEYGSLSDRVSTSERMIGNAPGVLPLFLLQHLLPISVTLHKTDLALDLPPCTQERHLVEPTPELLSRFKSLQQALVNQIKKDQFTEGLAGKLFGQLAELPSYLDRSTQDTGNCDEGDYEIRYPESVGGEVIASQEAFPASEVTPKEQWMLDRITQELDEGRNVMVFSWHLTLLPRLAGLIEREIGEKVPILYAAKVATAKRQDWITKQVVQKGVRVLVCNPVTIQTGLNNLVHFSTEIWMENPACSPVIYRQACGRIDRIGASKPTRLLFPIYAGTMQEQLHDLLMQKVAVATATDGLDPESALLASGVGTSEFMLGMSIGKQLWAMLTQTDVAA